MLGNIWKAHDSSPWQNNFINGIQIHNQSPWFKPMAIYSFKAQFSLATSKPNSHLQYQSLIFSLAISKPNSYWQHQSPIFIGTTLSKRKRAQDYQHLAKKKYRGKMLPWQKGPWQSSYKKTHRELSWGLCSRIINPWNTWTSFASRHQ